VCLGSSSATRLACRLRQVVGPKEGHQLAFAHRLTGALHQGDQEIQRAIAEVQGSAGFQQESLSRKWAKGAERYLARSNETVVGLTTLYLI